MLIPLTSFFLNEDSADPLAPERIRENTPAKRMSFPTIFIGFSEDLFDRLSAGRPLGSTPEMTIA